jgi:hypothetical protein
MLIKEVEKKYKFTVEDVLRTLDGLSPIPKDYIEVKKLDAEKTEKLTREQTTESSR